MKSLKLVLIVIVFFLINSVQAQSKVNENTGTQPSWGLVGSPEIRYCYLPDVEAYFDIQTSMYIYYDKGRWIRKANLPKQYNNYNVKNGYKVGITDYSGETPYIYFHEHKIKYTKGYQGKENEKVFKEISVTNIK